MSRLTAGSDAIGPNSSGWVGAGDGTGSIGRLVCRLFEVGDAVRVLSRHPDRAVGALLDDDVALRRDVPVGQRSGCPSESPGSNIAQCARVRDRR